MSFKLKAIAGVTIAGFALAGCNPDNSDSNGSGADNGTNENTGTLSLHVTDAPVDEAEAVVVSFVGVHLQPADGERIEIEYDEPKEIDLLALQGGEREALLEDESLAAGEYEWIRLQLDAEEGSTGSYIQLDSGLHELTIPSGNQTGLKLVRGFTVQEDGSASFTIDFDLRKSVVVTGGPNARYILKPTLRLVDDAEAGHIAGVVSDATVAGMTGDCSAGAAVYVFEGADATPVDVGGESEPVSSAMVDTTDTGVTEYEYRASFLVAGDYTVAFTCDADLDDPEAGEDSLEFVGAQNVTVTAEETASANF